MKCVVSFITHQILKIYIEELTILKSETTICLKILGYSQNIGYDKYFENHGWQEQDSN